MSLTDSIARFVVRCLRPNSARVLESVNDARTALGIPVLEELPVGLRGEFDRCPLARALPGVVGVDGVAFAVPDQAVAVANVWRTTIEFSPTGVFIAKLPRSLRRFVQDYDLGGFPELQDDSEGITAEKSSAEPVEGVAPIGVPWRRRNRRRAA